MFPETLAKKDQSKNPSYERNAKKDSPKIMGQTIFVPPWIFLAAASLYLAKIDNIRTTVNRKDAFDERHTYIL